MSFEKELKLAVEDIDIPVELLPANIEAMLRKAGTQNTETQTAPAAERVQKITASKHTNRSVIMRTIAAAAACMALVGGFAAYNDLISRPIEIESEIEYEAVKIQSYDELYNIYTGIYLNNSGDSSATNGDGVEIITDETAIIGDETAAQTQPAITEAVTSGKTETKSDEPIEAVRSDFSDADIVKSDSKAIYYICDGTLYVVSKNDMEVLAEIKDENKPFEMYVRGNSLVLVSDEIVSDTQSGNVVVDIFDISADTPTRIKTYKQNGVYNSARIDDDGILYLVTDYSNYREKPLDETASLETYVPGYYIDGEKYFVAAEDITVPQGADNTDYTIVSAIKCSEPVNISVKAVLGTNANTYCSDDTLYVAGRGTKDGEDYTAITSFAISESGLEYKAAAVVDGELISRYSMNEYNDMFRIACRGFDEFGMINTVIYTLDDSLQIVSQAGQLLPGVIASSVKFDGELASIMEYGEEKASLVVDLSKSTPVYDEGVSSFDAAYTAEFTDGLMIGVSADRDENGMYTSIRLEMYDTDNGMKICETDFAEYNMVDSPALYNKRALLVEHEHNVIGVPVSSVNEFGVKNQYYIFGYENGSFVQKGVIEYNDIDDSCKFERAFINDDMIYIIGSGRMVAVQLADMTVVDNFDFQ